MDKYDWEERITKTEFLVEGSTFDFWENWVGDQGNENWVQETGTSVNVSNKPGEEAIWVQLFWVIYEGALLCFWEKPESSTSHEVLSSLRELFPSIPNLQLGEISPLRQYLGYRKQNLAPAKLIEARRWIGREAVENFLKEEILTTRLLEYSQLALEKNEDGALEIFNKVLEIQEIGEKFCDIYWRPWLKRYYDLANSAGHEANIGPINLQMLGSAGRVMITLRNVEIEHTYVSLVGYSGEESDNMYVRGVYGKVTELLEILEASVRDPLLLQSSIKPSNTRLALG